MDQDPDGDPLIDLNAADTQARSAFRRQRALTIGLSGVAVLAVIAAGGLMVAAMRPTGGQSRPVDTAAGRPTLSQSTGTIEVTPSALPTTPAETTPATSTSTSPVVVRTQPAPTTESRHHRPRRRPVNCTSALPRP